MLIPKQNCRQKENFQGRAVFVEMPKLTEFLLAQFGLFSGRNTDFSGLRRLIAQDKDIDILFFDLFAPGYDALALLSQLRRLSFDGMVIALAPTLPDEDMVSQELATAGAGLHIHLLTAKRLLSA